MGDELAPVSFTDTNAETNIGAGKKATESQMEDLIGGLKKQKAAEEAESRKEKTEKKKKKKKGKGKKKKDKYKKMRGNDRFESQNYLMRIEGTICFAALMHAGLYVLITGVLLIVCLIWSKGDMMYLILKEDVTKESGKETGKEGDKKTSVAPVVTSSAATTTKTD